MEVDYIRFYGGVTNEFKYIPGSNRFKHAGKGYTYGPAGTHGMLGIRTTRHAMTMPQNAGNALQQKQPNSFAFKKPKKGITGKEAFLLPRGGSVPRVVATTGIEDQKAYLTPAQLRQFLQTEKNIYDQTGLANPDGAPPPKDDNAGNGPNNNGGGGGGGGGDGDDGGDDGGDYLNLLNISDTVDRNNISASSMNPDSKEMRRIIATDLIPAPEYKFEPGSLFIHNPGNLIDNETFEQLTAQAHAGVLNYQNLKHIHKYQQNNGFPLETDVDKLKALYTTLKSSYTINNAQKQALIMTRAVVELGFDPDVANTYINQWFNEMQIDAKNKKKKFVPINVKKPPVEPFTGTGYKLEKDPMKWTRIDQNGMTPESSRSAMQRSRPRPSGRYGLFDDDDHPMQLDHPMQRSIEQSKIVDSIVIPPPLLTAEQRRILRKNKIVKSSKYIGKGKGKKED